MIVNDVDEGDMMRMMGEDGDINDGNIGVGNEINPGENKDFKNNWLTL